MLLSLLRPGGFMQIGLYSALRAPTSAPRAHSSPSAAMATADDIRRCRQELLASRMERPLKNVTGYSDFFTTGECRDLLFHVQEHQFTIPEIRTFSSRTG